MKNTKRIISLILSAVLILSVCFTGGLLSASAAATVIDEGNLLLNGSFEQNNGAKLGFADMELKNGQTNYVGVDAWRYREHWWVDGSVTYTEKKIYATQATDARTGNFALKLTNQGTGDTGEDSVTIYPNKVAGDDATAYTTGNYKFSVWVKGTNTASYITYTNAAGTTNTVNITDVKADEWTQVVIENIAGFGTIERTPTGATVAETVLNLNLVVKTQDTATEIYFDDAVLEEVQVVDTDYNLFVNEGFEPANPTGSDITLTTTSNAGQSIDKSTEMPGWILHSWSPTLSTKTLTKTDAHSEGYALKLSVLEPNEGETDWNYTRYYVKTTNIDTSKITKGYYKLSVWVKGDATNAGITFQGQTITTPTEAANGWVKIETDAAYLSSAADLTVSATETNGVSMYSAISVYIKHTYQAGKYIMFDDICLEKVDNLFIDGGFEAPDAEATADIDSTHTSAAGGQTVYQINTNNYWTAFSWDHRATIRTRTIDSHSGNFALKVSHNSTYGTNGATFYPAQSNILTSNFEGGVYSLSCWVKGNNTSAYLKFGGQTVYVPAEAANGWVKLTIDNVILNDVDDLAPKGDGNGNNRYRYENLGFVVVDKSDTSIYVTIDDFELVRTGDIPTEDDVDNIFVNGDFESSEVESITIPESSGGTISALVSGWAAWHKASGTANTAAIVEGEGINGSKALKISHVSGGADMTLYPLLSSFDLESIKAGSYTLTAYVKTNYVKTNSTNSILMRIGYGGTDYSNTWNSYSGWRKVVINDVVLTEGGANITVTSEGDTEGRRIQFGLPAGTDVYYLIDNISLVPNFDTPNDVKDQITGIAQPAPGATALTMPALDTNNPNITVSIATSSNESVIALDGTITTPKVQTVVDVTLKVSDGTNEVILPTTYGVLVHGELDTVTQTVIEGAIDELDVKAEAAADDMTEIDGWLTEKPSYISTAKKNLYSQKKLVYSYDIESDYVLDKNDIAAVRDDLLGDQAQYNIRYLVTMYTKVVEYNGYN